MVALTVGGCATNESDALGTALVAPGKYVLYNCPEIAVAYNGLVARQRELEGLMAKASQDSGGRFVSAIAYDTDYARTKADLRVLRQEAVAKNCKMPDAAPAAAPKPSARAAKPAAR